MTNVEVKDLKSAISAFLADLNFLKSQGALQRKTCFTLERDSQVDSLTSRINGVIENLLGNTKDISRYFSSMNNRCQRELLIAACDSFLGQRIDKKQFRFMAGQILRPTESPVEIADDPSVAPILDYVDLRLSDALTIFIKTPWNLRLSPKSIDELRLSQILDDAVVLVIKTADPYDKLIDTGTKDELRHRQQELGNLKQLQDKGVRWHDRVRGRALMSRTFYGRPTIIVYVNIARSLLSDTRSIGQHDSYLYSCSVLRHELMHLRGTIHGIPMMNEVFAELGVGNDVGHLRSLRFYRNLLVMSDPNDRPSDPIVAASRSSDPTAVVVDFLSNNFGWEYMTT